MCELNTLASVSPYLSFSISLVSISLDEQTTRMSTLRTKNSQQRDKRTQTPTKLTHAHLFLLMHTASVVRRTISVGITSFHFQGILFFLDSSMERYPKTIINKPKWSACEACRFLNVSFQPFIAPISICSFCLYRSL